MSFERLCERRGKELAVALGCVVARDGDIWTIDTAHDSYPRAAGGSPPGLVQKVKNFAAAAVAHVAAGMPMASDGEIIRRHDICLQCEHLQGDACNLCGCPISRVAGFVSKLSWADQTCPAGKWGPEQSRLPDQRD